MLVCDMSLVHTASLMNKQKMTASWWHSNAAFTLALKTLLCWNGVAWEWEEAGKIEKLIYSLLT